jgi:hypothetical protein
MTELLPGIALATIIVAGFAAMGELNGSAAVLVPAHTVATLLVLILHDLPRLS